MVRAEYGGVACQARIDWLNPIDGRGIVDLKTCDNLDDFERDIHLVGPFANLQHLQIFIGELLVQLMQFFGRRDDDDDDRVTLQ